MILATADQGWFWIYIGMVLLLIGAGFGVLATLVCGAAIQATRRCRVWYNSRRGTD